MKDDDKTKKQLVHEPSELRSQNAELKKSITGYISAQLAAEEIRRFAESIVETVREPLLVLDADCRTGEEVNDEKAKETHTPTEQNR